MSDAKTKKKYPKFSEFAEPDHSLEGSKIKIDDVLNREILVLEFRISPSKFQKSNSEECLTIQFEFSDEPDKKYVLFTGSTVLTKQIQRYQEMMPFETTIKKVDRFYKFT